MGRKQSFYLILYVSQLYQAHLIVLENNENLFRKKIHILELDLDLQEWKVLSDKA